MHLSSPATYLNTFVVAVAHRAISEISSFSAGFGDAKPYLNFNRCVWSYSVYARACGHPTVPQDSMLEHQPGEPLGCIEQVARLGVAADPTAGRAHGRAVSANDPPGMMGHSSLRPPVWPSPAVHLCRSVSLTSTTPQPPHVCAGLGCSRRCAPTAAVGARRPRRIHLLQQCQKKKNDSVLTTGALSSLGRGGG